MVVQAESLGGSVRTPLAFVPGTPVEPVTATIDPPGPYTDGSSVTVTGTKQPLVRITPIPHRGLEVWTLVQCAAGAGPESGSCREP
jgi:hypothetical protein